MRVVRGVAALVFGGLLGCVPNNGGSTMVACDELTVMPDATPKRVAGTVFTIVIENHSRDEVVGSAQAPFITSLAREYGFARGYHDTFVHPSEANYLWMASGENFAVLDDDDPDAHHLASTSHIADQIERAGLTWKTYQEGMGAPCGLKSHGRYAAKHNPFVFFNDVNGWDGSAFHPSARCDAHVVDYQELDRDLASGKVADYVFITPDLDHDMHDGSVRDSDDWLRTEITKIMASDAYKRGGVIFLIGDEGGGHPAQDDPPFIVISEHAKKGFVSDADYDTSSYLKTVESLLGLPALPCDAGREQVDAMSDLFTVSLTEQPAPPPLTLSPGT
jgi:phospholipase C